MELSIDTASEMAGLALSEQGALVAELAWRCRRNHSVEVLPAIEELLRRAGATKADLTAVFVCSGPGGYSGLRVGISLAKGLAFALGLPIVGVGRLEMDAYQHAAYGGPICAVHRAGRGEVAWAVYAHEGGAVWREVSPPRLSPPDDLPRLAPAGSLFCGEIDDELAAAIARLGTGKIAAGAASVRRPGFLAELGWQRLRDGRADNPAALRPVYLREPAIAPPRSQ